MFVMKLSLQGDHIILRPFKRSDATDIYHHINDPEVVRWTLHIPHPYLMEHAYNFLRKVRADARKKRGYVFAIVLKETNQVIGGVGVEKIDWENKNGEQGYWLGKEYWGKGIMTEAMQLIAQFAFEELKLHRVYAHCFEGNIASRRVLEKCDFIHEGTMRQQRFRYDKWHDALIYGILESEWFAKRINSPKNG